MQSFVELEEKRPDDVNLDVDLEQATEPVESEQSDSEQSESELNQTPLEMKEIELEIDEAYQPPRRSSCYFVSHGFQRLCTATVSGLGAAIGGNLTYQVWDAAIQLFKDPNPSLRPYGAFFLTIGLGFGLMSGMFAVSTVCNLKGSFNWFRSGYRTFFDRQNTYELAIQHDVTAAVTSLKEIKAS